jgi:DNA-binding XRE family transcriptional regulator
MSKIPTNGLSALGSYLKELRRRKGWSLRQAAEQAGLSHATISRLEGGKTSTLPELVTLKIIAAAYGIPVELLLQFVTTEETAVESDNLLPPPPSLGNLLREWRVKRGLRPEELKRQVKWLDQSLLKSIEENSQEPSEKELAEIIDHLNLSLEESGELYYLGGVLNNALTPPVKQMCEQALSAWPMGPAYALKLPFWEVFASNALAAAVLFNANQGTPPVYHFEPPLPLLDILVNPSSLLSTMLSANNYWEEAVNREIALFRYLTRRFAYHSAYQQFVLQRWQNNIFFRKAWQQAELNLLHPLYQESEFIFSTPVGSDGKTSHSLRFLCYRCFLTADPRVLVTRFFPLDEPTREFIKKLA